MDMLRHHHVAGNIAPVPAAHAFELTLEGVAGVARIEQLHPPVTAEGDEVQAALALVTDRFQAHFWGL